MKISSLSQILCYQLVKHHIQRLHWTFAGLYNRTPLSLPPPPLLSPWVDHSSTPPANRIVPRDSLS
ncbi:hypothetical protein I7I53_09943 [Histoplasma capsulatum var. duboisii H88]|uniref:Uncharacterized protein n=1 Tax=Ajellomyces capsulatus (strain H88) TaxID=544711 RepID=A0A8A1L7E6_AJEC8|nr:hypothetical protein I7I53_09943 [Histoplasma capsulatum var. duboisii H88]